MKASVWAAGLMMAVLAGVSQAQNVMVEGAWVRATVAGQRATGAFMSLTADQDMTLIAVSTPVAGVSQVHEMRMQNDVMRMAEMKGGLPLPAGKAVVLAPGGHHLMLMDLKQAVQTGETIDLTLTLRNAQGKDTQQSVRLPVQALNAQMQHGSGAQHGAMGQHSR